MARSIVFALGVLIAAARIAGAQEAGSVEPDALEPDAPEPEEGVPPGRETAPGKAKALPDVPCAECGFACPVGTTACWACGARAPDSKAASEAGKALESVKLIRMTFPGRGGGVSASAAGVLPVIELERIEEWIDENPDEYNAALRRLNELLRKVRGTVLEGTVTTRVEEIRKEKAEAERERTPEEREAEAAKAYFEVMKELKDRSPKDRVRMLERLLRKAGGTAYEQAVARKLQSEKANLPGR